ncbi:MAG TPA: hypothetical protein VE863_05200 [Pyrinomonadaceae bacterium]|nr:hypothetical protein [Pyrinomonadaceae bacterium]
MSFRSLVILACLLIFSPSIVAQGTDASKAVVKTAAGNNKPARDPEAERILNERRASAQSLLINLAADARNFDDLTLRSRTQVRIADVLWEADKERARTMFRAAWDAAEIADKEGRERLQQDIGQQQNKTGSRGYAVTLPPGIRREVLRLAAQRDRALGEELLGKYKEQTEREAADVKNASRNALGVDERISQRLILAGQLLDAGDTERAIQFADPVLGDINMQSIDFLSTLREKDSAAADQRYAAMLATAPTNPQSDANTVSMLSSYIFTPHLYLAFQGAGFSTSQMSGTLAPLDIPAGLRDAFFRTAASILLRPLATPGQDQTTAGPDGQYLVIKRLLPLFEKYAPQEITTSLRAQLEALASVASNDAQQRDDESLKKGLGPEKPASDREQALLDRIDHAKTSAERDQLNLQLALFLAGKGDMRARDYVNKIDDTDTRNSARAYVDGSMASQAISKKDTDRALEFARTGELTHLQTSWLLAQAAKLLVKTDRDRALSLIDDAASEARRIDRSDPDSPRAFFGLANALLALNRAGAWDAMSEAIKASNSAEKFSGEDGHLSLRLLTKGMNAVSSNPVADFDVAGIFAALTTEDYEQALDLARGFEHEAPRANAVIAIARSVLEEKKN